jgi:hypothetical protein
MHTSQQSTHTLQGFALVYDKGINASISRFLCIGQIPGGGFTVPFWTARNCVTSISTTHCTALVGVLEWVLPRLLVRMFIFLRLGVRGMHAVLPSLFHPFRMWSTSLPITLGLRIEARVHSIQRFVSCWTSSRTISIECLRIAHRKRKLIL